MDVTTDRLIQIGKWAKTIPLDAFERRPAHGRPAKYVQRWKPGPPRTEGLFAVMTQSGRILTGTDRAFQPHILKKLAKFRRKDGVAYGTVIAHIEAGD